MLAAPDNRSVDDMGPAMRDLFLGGEDEEVQDWTPPAGASDRGPAAGLHQPGAAHAYLNIDIRDNADGSATVWYYANDADNDGVPDRSDTDWKEVLSSLGRALVLGARGAHTDRPIGYGNQRPSSDRPPQRAAGLVYGYCRGGRLLAVEGAAQAVGIGRRTDHHPRAGGEVEKVDVDPGVSCPTEVSAHLTRLVDDRNDLHRPLLAAFQPGRGQRLASAARIGHQDMQHTATLGWEAAGALDVDARIAQHLTDLGERARAILEVDGQIGRHRTCPPL